ncbi:branched-chain amino acid ABC transporter permease [Paralcaligenes sp. KSB-10]|uniref:branched-chain amino acid ABC transporter permease n=1 Tax=Paralcaligenes sp. KSB-10 TaxID=2901142 RepID=UPI001E51EA56|nr:branched-chain amino acid ABC transporter permease [Paralcaligenes sp. KSB-10]UHL65834.1 branched-chain amino acid ABC transporter permease [Paralcaligenes sp. KSB-10]
MSLFRQKPFAAPVVPDTGGGAVPAPGTESPAADGAPRGSWAASALQSRTAMGLGLLVILAVMWLLGLALGGNLVELLSLTIWGVMLGAIIALGGAGLTLCYGVLKFPNFAHGELLTIGAYVTYTVVSVLPKSAPIWHFSFGWELVAGLLVAIPVTGLISVLLDRVLYRRLRRTKAPMVLFAMASLGMAFFLRSCIYILWGSDFHFFYVGRANPALHLPWQIRVQADQIFVLALAVVLVVLVYLLLAKTRMGKAMRATADNPDLAQIRGIDTERVTAWTWGISGALAAAGGVMYGLASQLRPDMGFTLLLPMFAAVILGTIGNAFGALVGAIVIGVAIQVTSSFMNPAYGPAVAFALMVLVLVVRPQGLFGEK